MSKKFLLCLTALVWLAGCSQEAEQPAATAETPAAAPSEEPLANADSAPGPSAELALEALAEDPEALRQAMRDPDQRQALIEAMRERRQARQSGTEEDPIDREAMREQMRERREQMMAGRSGAVDPAAEADGAQARMMRRNQWWADDSLRDSIGLSETQAEALSERQAALEADRTAAQQALSQNQRELMGALRAGDRDQIMALLDAREAAAQSAQALDNQWWRILLEELSDEQIRTLAEEHPQLILGRRSR